MFDKKVYMKQWRKNNPGYHKQWLKNNPEYNEEYQKPYMKQWQRNKCKTDLKFHLNRRMGKNIGKALRGNKSGRHWESLIGYTLSDLLRRLKDTMPADYTWKDFLTGRLHIDHIVPISAHNFTKPEHADFKRCWALSNLRLLPAKENMTKHAKLDKSFQPALQI